MIYSSSRQSTVVTSSGAYMRFKDSKVPTIPISYTAVVASLKRVFAWVCG